MAHGNDGNSGFVVRHFNSDDYGRTCQFEVETDETATIYRIETKHVRAMHDMEEYRMPPGEILPVGFWLHLSQLPECTVVRHLTKRVEIPVERLAWALFNTDPEVHELSDRVGDFAIMNDQRGLVGFNDAKQAATLKRIWDTNDGGHRGRVTARAQAIFWELRAPAPEAGQ